MFYPSYLQPLPKPTFEKGIFLLQAALWLTQHLLLNKSKTRNNIKDI